MVKGVTFSFQTVDIIFFKKYNRSSRLRVRACVPLHLLLIF